MAAKNRIGILSGGAGTRLWPLSREAFPKQFYALGGTRESLLAAACRRLQKRGELSIITTENLRSLTQGLLNREGIAASILGEPQARNTAAAVGLFTWQALRQDADMVLGIFPADALIQNEAAFARALDTAFASAAKGRVVTLGLTPTYPATAYGYLELKENGGSDGARAVDVARFVEKPQKARAEELMRSGRAVWNAGMFVFPARLMAQHLERLMPELWQGLGKLNDDLSNLRDVYATLPSTSIDFGVMEHLNDILCVPVEMGWSDMGSWEEVSTHTPSQGAPVQLKGEGNHYSAFGVTEKQVAFVGVQDTVLVETPDAVLVLKKGEGQSVKDVVATLKGSKPHLLKQHTFEERPWGRFEVLLDTPYFKSKRISVWSGQRLSYQSHAKRAEHWIIVRGEAEVTLNDDVKRLKAGDAIFIPLGAKHRIANPGSEVMEFIEVQTGSYFGEDDIVRYSDDYGRSR